MAAEEELRTQIERKFPDKDEGIVTELFQAELRAQFEMRALPDLSRKHFKKTLRRPSTKSPLDRFVGSQRVLVR